MILALVLVLVIPYYVHLRRLLGSHARIPRAPRRGGGRWRGRELDRAGDVLRQGRVGRCVTSGRGVERNQEEDVRVQQVRQAFCVYGSVRAYVWKKIRGKGRAMSEGTHGRERVLRLNHTYLNAMRMYVTWSMPPS